MMLKYVKQIKGTANKNGMNNATCKQGLKSSNFMDSILKTKRSVTADNVVLLKKCVGSIFFKNELESY